MTREYIEVTGARENNLRDVSVRVPKRAITAFVGVSGSGKSSLVFDTIAAEAQRQLNETFSAFVRGFLPKLGQPDADLITNLSTAIVVDQRRLGGGSRSTLGTVTDVNALLRLLWSRRSTPHVGAGFAFSFNEPQGMCPECNGIGRVVRLDHGLFFDRTKSLNEGAILHRDFAVDSWYWHTYAQSGRFDNDKPLGDYTDAEWQLLLYGADEKIAIAGPGRKTMNVDFEGVDTKFTRLYIAADENGASERKKETVARFTTSLPCPECAGTRLNEAARTADGRRAHPAPGARARRWSTCTPCCPPCAPTRSGRWSTRPSRGSARSSTWAWATSPSTGRPPRCRAGSRSGSRWSATSGRRWSTSCTCSTSPRSACTRATSAG